jgi:hypothetical protein
MCDDVLYVGLIEMVQYAAQVKSCLGDDGTGCTPMTVYINADNIL